MPRKWPWPGDSKIGQVQRIARSYRALLDTIAPHLATAEDRKWFDLGHYWVDEAATIMPQPEQWLTAADAAHYVSQWYPCSQKDIYRWANRNEITQRTEIDGSTRYLWSSILARDAGMHRKTA